MTSDEDPRRTIVRRLAVALGVVLSAFLLLQSWRFGQAVAGIDYYQFWVVGQAIEHDGVRDPYTDAERAHMGALYRERGAQPQASPRHRAVSAGRTVLETYSTPFLYALIHALASGDYERDFTRWHAVSLFAFAAGTLGLARLVGFGWLPSLALLSAFLAFAAPLQSDVQVGNVNRAQLGALALAAAMLRAPGHVVAETASGALLGVAVMFKPNIVLVPLLLLAFFVLRREHGTAARVCAGISAGVLVAFATSSVFFASAGSWWDWMHTLRAIPDEIIRVQLGNYAPLLFLFGEEGAGYSLVVLALLCVPVVLSFVVSRDESLDVRRRTIQIVAVLGLGCTIFLASANLVWEHYFLLALPLLLAVLRDASVQEVGDARGWLLARVLPGLALLGLLATPTASLSGLPHEVYFPLVQGGAIAALYVLGVMLLREGGTRGAA